MRTWTFSAKVAAALALMVVLTIAVGVLASLALRSVVQSKDRVIDVNAENVAQAERVRRLVQQRRAALREFVLVPEQEFVTELVETTSAIDEIIRQLEANGVAEAAALRERDAAYRAMADSIVAARRSGGSIDDAVATLVQASTVRESVERATEEMVERQETSLTVERQAATDTATAAVNAILVGIALAVVAAIAAALTLTRTLTSQIGAAVQHVRSSSAELQAAANQQASGSKEQATAMTEITTTISELLATSRQIAESAQRVARVAEETADAGRAGEQTVLDGAESIAGIKRQVDAIVTHMLELGRKSQEIGGILEIITELAEQTNILSVNAAIEAAGAGDAGRRFGVVAEQIRKLADRVSGSTKEIRELIQEVRAAVNASVMTTETASKTVEAGATHFSRVSTSFRDISHLVRTTNEAAREIELSTKQQTSAVEQVNRGVADVAQAAKETEVTSAQMLDTVSQLATLSLDLSRLVRSEPGARA
jgi:methyl-accepting chemotaxis protein